MPATYNRPVAVPKILLFYRFTPLADPEAIRLWQRDLCRSLNVRGRIIVSSDGINGTVGGELRNVKRYVRSTREYAPFRDLDVKWSEGSGDDFPRLSVKVRTELVSFGAPGELRIDDTGVIGGGTRITPEQLHDLVERREVTFFDGRNGVEAAVGRFEGAVVPPVSSTRDFVSELDSGRYDHLKSTPVVTYCTGGIRCEVLSSLMINRGFTEVYQLDGGIMRYGEAYRDSGLWTGALYVFDGRKTITFSENAVPLGSCHRCEATTSRVENCHDLACREQLVTCDACADSALVSCAQHGARARRRDVALAESFAVGQV